MGSSARCRAPSSSDTRRARRRSTRTSPSATKRRCARCRCRSGRRARSASSSTAGRRPVPHTGARRRRPTRRAWWRSSTSRTIARSSSCPTRPPGWPSGWDAAGEYGWSTGDKRAVMSGRARVAQLTGARERARARPRRRLRALRPSSWRCATGVRRCGARLHASEPVHSPGSRAATRCPGGACRAVPFQHRPGRACRRRRAWNVRGSLVLLNTNPTPPRSNDHPMNTKPASPATQQ